jgi:iron complex outermembrane recepter protein
VSRGPQHPSAVRAIPLLLFTLLVTPVAVRAEDSALQKIADVDIPAKPLGDAIVELSRQSQIQIVVASDEVEGVTSKAVRGRMSVGEALARLLEGTNLEARDTDARTIGIGPRGSRLESAPRLESTPPPAEGESVPTSASEAPRSRTIEEIVVTAQRKEEQLQDVPISMSVLDDEFLRRQGVTDLQDVARYVPNVRIDQSGGLILPRIRGFSTMALLTRGFEQPVGLTVDEVPYGRAEYFTAGLFDLERVEVLRGPQGQLFGANTTVGLLNLTTKDPTDELTGSIDLELGELEHRRVEAAAGGPVLAGFLNFRMAGLIEEREGYVENTTASLVPAEKLLGGRDREAIRLKLDFPDLFGARLLVSYQRDDLDYDGTPIELTSITPNFQSFFRQFDARADYEPNNLVASIDSPGVLKVGIDTFVARGSYDLGGWGLHTVLGWSRLQTDTHIDDDSPAPVYVIDVDELSRQATYELRVTSPDLPGFFGLGELFGLPLGSTDFTSGFFFQDRRLSPTKQSLSIDGPLFLEITAVNAIPAPLPFPPGSRPPTAGFTEHLRARFEQGSKSFSGFGQMNWRFMERWTLLSGLRLDHTIKDAAWNQRIDPDTAVLLHAVFGEFVGEDTRSASELAPKVGMKFDWTEDVDLYWTWASNFQAGGFNNFSTLMDPNRRRYDASRVHSWEAGAKVRLLDGAADVNLGLFHMTMDDFQLNTNQEVGAGISVGTIINAGELRARGVEVDSTWLPTDWLTVRASLGFNDTEFLDFPFGTCITNRENTDGDGDVRCDLTGGPLVQAPKWGISMIPSVRVPLASLPVLSSAALPGGIALTSDFTAQYTDTRFLNDTLDPRTRQPSYFLFDASIGLVDSTRGWSIQLRVENLADERTASIANEVALATGVISKSVDPPRVVIGKFRWEF